MQITLLSLLDYAGVAMFAASGALMAAQKRQDVVTFLFFAAISRKCSPENNHHLFACFRSQIWLICRMQRPYGRVDDNFFPYR